MRRLISTCSILTIAGTASAHGLSEDAGTVAQLGHQLLGSHHAPLVILLLVIGVVAIRAYSEARRN